MSTTVSSKTKVVIPIIGGGPRDLLLSQIHDIGRFHNISDRPIFPVSISHPTLTGKMAPTADIGIVLYGITYLPGFGPLGSSWSISGKIPFRYFEAFDWLKPYGLTHTIFDKVRYRHTEFVDSAFNTQSRSGYLTLTTEA